MRTNKPPEERFFTEINLQSLWRKVYQHKWLFLLGILAGLAVAAWYLERATPIYQARMTLLIDPSGQSRTMGESQYLEGGVGLIEKEKNIFNEIGVLQSYGLALEALQELDFRISYYSKNGLQVREHYQDFPFEVTTFDSSAQLLETPFFVEPLNDAAYRLTVKAKAPLLSDPDLDRIVPLEGKFFFEDTVAFGEEVRHAYFHLVVHRPSADRFSENLRGKDPGKKWFFRLHDIEALAAQMAAGLTVEQSDIQSSILRLESRGPVVEKQLDFLNRLSEKYLVRKMEERTEIAVSKQRFILEQLESVEDSLARAEVELEAFRRGHQAINLQHTATSVLDQLQQLDSDREQIRLNLEYYHSLLTYIQSDSNLNKIIAPSVVGINDPLLNENLLELKRLNTQRTRQGYSKGSKSHDLEILNRQIQATTTALQESVRNLIAASEMALRDVDNRIASLDVTLNRLPRSEKELLKYERRSALFSDLYKYLSQEMARAEIARAEDIPDAHILDRARMVGNGPVFPKRDLILLLGLLGGLLLPLAWVVYFVTDDELLTDQKTLERFKDIPVVGSIGHFESRRRLFSSASSHWQVLESFRDVTAYLQFILPDTDHHIFGLTSVIPGEGKSFCAINLAINFARQGKKTLLIDTDLRNPSILPGNEQFEGPGLSSFLRGETSDPETVIRHHPDLAELDYLPTQVDVENPPFLLSGKRMEYLIDTVKRTYDVIILDTPAMGIVSDYLLLSHFIDTHLFVVRRDYTKLSHLNAIETLRKKGNLKSTYFILNDVKGPTFKYGYGYGYGKEYGYYKYSKTADDAEQQIDRHLPTTE